MSATDELIQPYKPWLRWLIWLLLAVAFMFALRQLMPILSWAMRILTPFLIGLVLAYVFNPIVNFVQGKLKLGRVGGILVLVLILLVLTAGLVVWLVPVLYQQVATMIEGVRTSVPMLVERFLANHVDPETLKGWKQQINDFFTNFDQNARESVSQVGGSLAPVAEGGFKAVTNIAGTVMAFFGGIGGFLATMGFAVIASFYFLADLDEIPITVRRGLPERNRERIWDLMVKSDQAVGGFLRGQLIDCACIAVLTTIALMLIGLKQYAVLIGVFAGIMNFIPYLGPIAGATPAILWALATDSMGSWNERGWAIGQIIGSFAVVQMIDGLLLQPFVVGKQASLHPLLVMLALAVGAQFGLGGMIIAVPITCVLRVLWIELVWKERAANEEASFVPKKREVKPGKS